MTWTAVTAKLYLIPSQSFRSTMPTWRCLSSCVTGRNKTFLRGDQNLGLRGAGRQDATSVAGARCSSSSCWCPHAPLLLPKHRTSSCAPGVIQELFTLLYSGSRSTPIEQHQYELLYYGMRCLSCFLGTFLRRSLAAGMSLTWWGTS
jgi:hypothetical protein